MVCATPSSFTSRYYSRREEEQRCLMVCGGLTLAAIGLASRSFAGLLLAGIGGYVAYENAGRPPHFGQLEHENVSDCPIALCDEIDRSSADSFPASDPPAHCTTSVW